MIVTVIPRLSYCIPRTHTDVPDVAIHTVIPDAGRRAGIQVRTHPKYMDPGDLRRAFDSGMTVLPYGGALNRRRQMPFDKLRRSNAPLRSYPFSL
jgi:hypothetical protein